MSTMEYGPVGPEWHNSPEKLHLDEQLRDVILPGACIISTLAYTVLKPYCSEPLFIQDRVTTGDNVFPMIKIRTFDDPENLSKIQKIVRTIAADELIQVGHVTQGADRPLSMVSWRTTTREDLIAHQTRLRKHGCDLLAEKMELVSHEIRGGQFGIDSLVDQYAPPGSLKASIYKAEKMWFYYTNGSYTLDMTIICNLLWAAAHLLPKGSVHINHKFTPACDLCLRNVSG